MEGFTHIKCQFAALSLHPVCLLLAVSAAGPVTSNGNCSYCHQKDDHHVVVQHRLIGCVHGNLSSFAKGLQELKTAYSQGKCMFESHKTCIILHLAKIHFDFVPVYNLT